MFYPINRYCIQYQQDNFIYYLLKYLYRQDRKAKMATSPILAKAPLNLQSTQQALNMLRNLREKRKKQNPATIYELVKDIHGMLKDPNPKKGSSETLSSEDYLGGNRESIEDMLLFIKNKIADGLELSPNPEAIQQSKASEEALKQNLSKKEEEIKALNEMIKSSEGQAKTMQIKLLNNMKRLSLQLQERDVQLGQLKRILNEKQSEFEEMRMLNEKQHRKIRKMEEDLYDLQVELEQRNEELEAERQCADFLEKRVGRFLDHESHVIHQQNQRDNQSEVLELQERSMVLTQQEVEQKSDMATQTDTDSPVPSPPSSEQNHQQTSAQMENDDQMSQNSSVLTESKESKYIESIERLTMELGEAYQRINELMKDGEPVEQCKTVEFITSAHVQLQPERTIKNMVNVGEAPKGGKSKSRSGYFSKFWK